MRAISFSEKAGLAAAVLMFVASCGGGSNTSTSPSGNALAVSISTPGQGASLGNVCSATSWSFAWSGVGATRYHIQVLSPAGALALDRDDLVSPSFDWRDFPEVPAEDLRGWRVRVRAQTGGAWGAWTERTFDVDTIAPKLLEPLPNAMLDNGCVDRSDARIWTFRWSACRDTNRYRLYVIAKSASLPAVDLETVTPTYTFSDNGFVGSGFEKGWSWWVQARRANGTWTDASTIQTFDVEPANSDCSGLPAPVQQSPANGAVFNVTPRLVTFAWQSVAGAARYSLDLEFCAATDPACTGTGTPVPGSNGITTTTYTIPNWVTTSPSRWRVAAVSAGGVPGPFSPWSTFRFTQ